MEGEQREEGGQWYDFPTVDGPGSQTNPKAKYDKRRWQLLVDEACGAAETLLVAGYEVWKVSPGGDAFDALRALDPDIVIGTPERVGERALTPPDDPRDLLGFVRAVCADQMHEEQSLAYAISRPGALPQVIEGARPRTLLRTLAATGRYYLLRASAPDLEVELEVAAGGLGVAKGKRGATLVVGLSAVQAFLSAPPGLRVRISELPEYRQSFVDYPALQEALLRAAVGAGGDALDRLRDFQAQSSDQSTVELRHLGVSAGETLAPPANRHSQPDTVTGLRRPDANDLPDEPQDTEPMAHPPVARVESSPAVDSNPPGRLPRSTEKLAPVRARGTEAVRTADVIRALTRPSEGQKAAAVSADEEVSSVPSLAPWHSRLWWLGWAAFVAAGLAYAAANL